MNNPTVNTGGYSKSTRTELFCEKQVTVENKNFRSRKINFFMYRFLSFRRKFEKTFIVLAANV